MKTPIAIISAAVLSFAVAGCTTAEQTATAGALGGAALGAAIDDNNRGRGALIGAAVGGTSGFLLGRLANGNCRYRAADGSTYIAACP